MGIQYRPEIDGLRAIAVLAVVLYHAGIGGAGFVGVDVFFVISGYLITSLLLKEHRETGSIDLLAFYARRVRRIFPAAAVVGLATLGVSALVLDPLAQMQVARSAGAALAFVANVFFQLTTGGYWDGASEEMPLLHLWSLSVEEQFYFVWPATLLLVRSRKAMLVLAIASLGLAEYWIARGSDAAFYQMPARFWELAVGGLIAASPVRRLPAWMAPVGVLVTLAACVFPLGHFPGIGALPAVAGAALIIAAVHGGATNRFLASRPMVGVGLISYSLYLWHWPLLAFYAAEGWEDPLDRFALLMIAALLAMLSYRFVEQPFRRMRFASGRTVATGASLSAVLALTACAIGLREPPKDPKSVFAAKAAADHMPIACLYEDGDPVPKCPEPPGARVFVWGDSMGWSWSAGFPGAAVYSFPGCLPAVGRHAGKPGCEAWNDEVVRRLHGDVLVLAARWEGYGSILDMERTLEAAKGFQRIVVIGPVPKPTTVPGRCIRGEAPGCSIPRASFDKLVAPALVELHALAARYPNVEVLDVTDQFCTRTECPMIRDGLVLYHDAYHPSMTQVRHVLSVRAVQLPDSQADQHAINPTQQPDGVKYIGVSR